MKIHEIYIQRCIQLALNGLGTTYPNPLVGSVIVCDGKIIGEGWHRKAGEPHAEVLAIRSVKNKGLLKKSTIYVSLEPCSHFGKTPPCCDLILENEIPTIVVGTIDSYAAVSGRGIQKLRAAGRNVLVGVLEKECQALNKRFFSFHNQQRPYIILKWAQSADGYIAPLAKEKQEPVWISNSYARQLTHKWRSEEQAVLVGTQTVLDDNPKLDTRDWAGSNPLRLVVDRTGKISTNYFVKDGKVPTIVFTAEENKETDNQVVYQNCIFDSSLPKQITTQLFENQVQSVIIEGGSKTLQLFIDSGLWDEARVFESGLNLGTGVKAPQWVAVANTTETIVDNQLKIYYRHD